jgi:hypothetical protein
MSVQGNIKPVRSLTEPLQVAMDNGAKRALIPIENKRNFLDVSADIMEHVDSIHKSAEQLGTALAEITQRYDELERHMLVEFFDFIKSRHGYSFIHWNMRDINYGFQAIEHRFKVLGGVPFVIDDARKFDLARELINRFGPGYVPHGSAGRLHSLMELNHITARDALTGQEEADAFDAGEYVKLHQSTLRKVDVMANILERVLDGSVRTRATWRETTGYHPAVIIELAREHWLWSLVGVAAAIIGLVSALKGLL